MAGLSTLIPYGPPAPNPTTTSEGERPEAGGTVKLDYLNPQTLHVLRDRHRAHFAHRIRVAQVQSLLPTDDDPQTTSEASRK
jgi:hypothetical protein